MRRTFENFVLHGDDASPCPAATTKTGVTDGVNDAVIDAVFEDVKLGVFVGVTVAVNDDVAELVNVCV